MVLEIPARFILSGKQRQKDMSNPQSGHGSPFSLSQPILQVGHSGSKHGSKISFCKKPRQETHRGGNNKFSKKRKNDSFIQHPCQPAFVQAPYSAGSGDCWTPSSLRSPLVPQESPFFGRALPPCTANSLSKAWAEPSIRE